jgi:hypothetical protein
MQAAVAFLLDADNLNDPVAVAQAIEQFHELVGTSTIRRAYGSNDSLKGLAGVLKQYAIRPCANFVLEKNTTDMALAVDAMEIACTAQPSVIAIGSGDMDFLPLVARLRERGVRVIGFSLNGKMSTEVMPAYPELYFVGKAAPARRTPAAVAPAPASAAQPARPAAAKKVPVKKVPAKKAAAKKAAPAPARKTATAPRSAAGTQLAPTLQEILDAVPRLRAHEFVQINEVAQALRAALRLGRSASSVKLLERFPGEFELVPQSQPNQVRWSGGGRS